jgi:hypothetical protein
MGHVIDYVPWIYPHLQGYLVYLCRYCPSTPLISNIEIVWTELDSFTGIVPLSIAAISKVD